jgi:RNA 2',3'-cyclic 3'-phosphodiesterase
MRLFFAALPAPEIRDKLGSAVDALRLPTEARRVPAENYHLTMAFAGEVSQSQAAVIRSLGAKVRSPAFVVRLTTYEHWPRSEVIVAAASNCPPDGVELHRQLRCELEHLGVVREAIGFRAHVTLARKVTQAPVLKAMSPISWRVEALHLVRSSRAATGSVYTVIDTWPLLDNAPHGE